MKFFLVSTVIAFVCPTWSWVTTSSNVCCAKKTGQYTAMAFDAYGTLLDVATVPSLRAAHLNLPPSFTALWREKQLSYSWLRNSMNRYVDFWELTKDALDYSLQFYNRTLTSSDKKYLLRSWYHLTPYPEVREGLERLKASGRKLFILSNGAPRMLSRVLKNAGLRSFFSDVISVDPVKTFKPNPSVYALLEQESCIAKKNVLFVSSNSWDAAGAKSYGYNTAWLKRSPAPADVLGFPPNYYFSNLLELVTAFP